MAATDPRILCPDLVGRDHELAALATHLASVRASDGSRTVLVTGDAGSGKSALLRTFLKSARSAEVPVLLGECVALEIGRPFGVFVQILQSARVALPSGTLERTIRQHAPDLARLLPEFGMDAARAEARQPAERYRIHESFVTLFRHLVARAPMVVAVEDLHWADDASLELLPFIASRLRREQILILATYRGEALASSPSLERAIAELDRGRLAERIAVAPLDVIDTAVLVQRALSLNHPAPAEVVDALYARCEGNPFFTEEVLKALADRGDLRYEKGSWHVTGRVRDVALPDSVRMSVERRTNALSPQASRAVQVAAVIGQHFEFTLLRAVSGLPEQQLIDALHAAFDAQLIVDELGAAADQRYAFRHALTREAVLGQLLKRERRLLHQAVGDALEVRMRGDESASAAELAYHFDEAGDIGRARRYHDHAGREALRLFAFARAVTHFERVAQLATADDPLTAEDWRLIARAASLTNDAARAATAADEAVRLLETAPDAEQLGLALFEASEYRWALGEMPASDGLLARAKVVLDPLGDSHALASVDAWYSMWPMIRDDFEATVTQAERALGMARRTGNWQAEVRALEALGVGMAALGQDGAIARARESVAVALAHDGVSEAQNAYVQLQATMDLSGASGADADAMREERLAHGRRHSFRPTQLMDLESGAAMAAGDWDTAIAIASEMQADSVWTGHARTNVALMLIARGGPAKGLPLHAEVMRGRETLAATNPMFREGFACDACRTALFAGDARGALDHAEYFADRLEGGTPLTFRSHTAIHALIAARRLADADALARWIELAAAETGNGRILHVRARRAMARAERAAAAGDLDRAIGELTACSELLAQPTALHSWMFLPGTFVHQRRAELLRERGGPGDREAAGLALATDVPYLRRAQATWYLAQLQAWAREHDVPFLAEDSPPGNDRDEPIQLQLTAREREVAVLVAQGASNREIAERLGVAERTAEGHVEQIRNKLGFRSRAQIAAWVAETMPRVLH